MFISWGSPGRGAAGLQARLVLKTAECDRLEKTDGGMRAALRDLEQRLEAAEGRRDGAERGAEERLRAAEEEARALSARLRQTQALLDDALAAEKRLKVVASEAHTIAESLQERKAKVSA